MQISRRVTGHRQPVQSFGAPPAEVFPLLVADRSRHLHALPLKIAVDSYI